MSELFGLFYIDKEHDSHVNLRQSGPAAINTYIRCADLLRRSALAQGYNFAVITNEVTELQYIAASLNLTALSFIKLPFNMTVPKHIPFYQAHFKIAVLKAFGEGMFGDSIALLDLDMVMARRLEFPILKNPSDLVVYDISDNVPKSYSNSLEFLTELPGNHRWFGGEFIAGTPEGFRALNDEVQKILPIYLANVEQMPHVGDEAIVSAALNIVEHNGSTLIDAGKLGIVARWWSSRTDHQQRKFSELSSSSLLHLPSDKKFLASYGPPKAIDDFETSYVRYLKFKIASAQILGRIAHLNGSRRKFSPLI